MEKSSHDPTSGQGLEIIGIIIKALASALKKTKINADNIQKIIGNPGVIFKMIEGLLDGTLEAKLSPVKLLSAGEIIKLEALDGKDYILKAKETFKSLIRSDFKELELDQSGPATIETRLDLCEVTGNGSGISIFGGISRDLDKIIMTQAQIISFCQKYPNLLNRVSPTLFLMKKGNTYYIVYVSVYPEGLCVGANLLRSDDMFYARHHYYVVIPQLKYH